jgi:Transmembrane secretion effector
VICINLAAVTLSTGKAPRDGVSATAGSSAWAPFRSPDFARMASAQFVSNVGGWMQTVGAQELMLTLTSPGVGFARRVGPQPEALPDDQRNLSPRSS